MQRTPPQLRREALSGTTKTFPGAVAIAVNGSRKTKSSYQLDGGITSMSITNVNQPFPMPTRFRSSACRPATTVRSYGQNAGAVVNIITKSGTNKLMAAR